MAAKKCDKEVIVVSNQPVPIYFGLIEKVHNTLQERLAGRNVRVSLNQAAGLTNSEVGRANPKGTYKSRASLAPSTSGTPKQINAPAARTTSNDTPTNVYNPLTAPKKVPQPPALPTLPQVMQPQKRPASAYEGELKDEKPTIETKKTAFTGIADIVSHFTAKMQIPSTSSSTCGVKTKCCTDMLFDPRSNHGQKEAEKKLLQKMAENPPEHFEIKRAPDGKLIFYLQDPPLPGPRPVESVPYRPAKDWDDAYFQSRLPTSLDVFNAGREYMTDLRLPEHPPIFAMAINLARKQAMEKLKEEQIRKIREEKWKEIVADERGPGDPPKEMRCRRCHGNWMKVMELKRSKGSADGQKHIVKCLVCRNYCCFLILQKEVPWEVGRFFGQPKKEELMYGRSRIDPKMNGDPTRRMKEYLEDLAIYRWVLRQNGDYEEFPYTLVSGQKEPVRML